MINGVWKHNQGEGVILDSFVDGDRRLYRIYLGDHIASCPLPDPEFEITDERVRSGELDIDFSVPEVRHTGDGSWWTVGSRYADYIPPIPWTPRWMRTQVSKAWRRVRARYFRIWPPPERYLGWCARATEGGNWSNLCKGDGTVTRSQVADGRRLYDVEFDDCLVVTHLPNPRNFELFEPGQ